MQTNNTTLFIYLHIVEKKRAVDLSGLQFRTSLARLPLVPRGFAVLFDLSLEDLASCVPRQLGFRKQDHGGDAVFREQRRDEVLERRFGRSRGRWRTGRRRMEDTESTGRGRPK